MGSFSWMRADMCTQRSNLTYGDSYKILIPKELGGGYIKDKYWDYGRINAEEFNCAVYVDENNKKHKIEGEHDLYGLLAYMNRHTTIHPCCERFEGFDALNKNVGDDIMDIIRNGNTRGQDIRMIGIDIGCYDKEINSLKYPLKLVSVSFKGTYEDCDMISYGDDDQGFVKKTWERDYDAYERKTRLKF